MSGIFLIENYLWLVFTVCYLYQFIYVLYMLVIKSGKRKEETEVADIHKFGVVIAARNEKEVIGSLIDSIYAQEYPKEMIRVYVVADNCSDNTAEIARERGAAVFERNDLTKIGKGYALNFVFDKILKEDVCDAYIMLDADNLVSPDFMTEINKTYSKGYRVVLGYRNSKNYASNWISAGYSLWFLRDSEYLNHPRMLMKTSCLVAGTGFLICRSILEESGGWNYFSLTEDVEFTANMIISGEKIGYCQKAMFFDEQPVEFRQSWVQRVRWARGFYQTVWKYGKKLIRGAVIGRNFACFDMLMSIFPALLITLVYFLFTLARMCMNIVKEQSVFALLFSFLHLAPFIIFGYTLLYVLGLIPTITEWDKIDATARQKIFYTFTFPAFMLTFIPIAGVALFKKVEWEPVKHAINKKIEDMVNNK